MLASNGLAQEASLAKALRWIDQASREIIVVAPVLRVRGVADHLRWAMVSRGVEVLILGDTRINDKGSYFDSLVYAGAKVRTIAKVSAFEVYLDGNTVIRGEALGAISDRQPEVLNHAGVKAMAQRVRSLWAKGRNHVPQLPQGGKR